MKVFTKTSNPELKTNGIREVVWNGKYTETDRNMVRGAVGQTPGGGYKTAEVHMTLEKNAGGISGRESWKWDSKLHADKDQAISASRENVERIVAKDRTMADQREQKQTPRTGAAQKYGRENERAERITPPSRSR